MTEASVSPPDVGSILREARLRRGQTLDVVHQHTRIPKKLLEALENNRFDDFPAPVYLRGFLKGYCDHLDLDFEPLWERIAPPKPAESKKPGDEPAQEPPHTAAAPSAAQASKKPQAKQPIPAPPAGFQLQPWMIIAACLLLGAAAMFSMRRPKPEAVPAPVAMPKPQPPAAVAPIQRNEKMKLAIVFKGDAWLRLMCDGALRFEGKLPAGSTQEWTATKDFVLRTTEPDNLSLTLDGREVRLDAAQRDPSGDYKLSR